MNEGNLLNSKNNRNALNIQLAQLQAAWLASTFGVGAALDLVRLKALHSGGWTEYLNQLGWLLLDERDELGRLERWA